MSSKFYKIQIFLISYLFVSSLSAVEILKKEISFTVDHPTKYVVGICHEVSTGVLNIQSKGKDYSLASPFSFQIPLSKISAGNSNLDTHMKEILGYPDFPMIEAKINSVVPASEGGYIWKGNITIHGVTRELQAPVSVSSSDQNTILVEGKAIIRFSEYNLENPSLLFIKAKDEIEVKFLFLIRLK